MAYAYPIHSRNTHALYNQYTPYLIGQCDVVMATGSHFEYANQVVKFSKFLFKKWYF